MYNLYSQNVKSLKIGFTLNLHLLQTHPLMCSATVYMKKKVKLRLLKCDVNVLTKKYKESI